MEWLGWIGGLLLALCGLPQAVKTFLDGHSDGVSWWFLIMWFVGEVLVLIYIIPSGQLPLIVNYAVNIIFAAIILKYKIKPKRSGRTDSEI